MKTEEEIKYKIKNLTANKSIAKRLGYEQAYIINCKLIKLFKWVLDEEEVKVDRRKKLK